MKYRVKTGIFEGHEFDGTPMIIGGEKRIVDNGTAGRAYPEENCEQMEIPIMVIGGIYPGSTVEIAHALNAEINKGKVVVIEDKTEEMRDALKNIEPSFGNKIELKATLLPVKSGKEARRERRKQGRKR